MFRTIAKINQVYNGLSVMLHFTSVLKPDHTEILEKLLFFNPGQEHAYSAIVDALDLFGKPEVAVEAGKIRIKVEKLGEVQSLFALDNDELVGVLIYSRVSEEHIAVIHIAVDHDYSSRGIFSQRMLVTRMLNLLRNNAKRIKGIEAVCLLYGNNRVREIKV
jgi:hypothetical protein